MGKKILSFFGLCAYAVGVLGGLGFSLAGHGWFIAACIAVLGVMAFPSARECYKTLAA